MRGCRVPAVGEVSTGHPKAQDEQLFVYCHPRSIQSLSTPRHIIYFISINFPKYFAHLCRMRFSLIIVFFLNCRKSIFKIDVDWILMYDYFTPHMVYVNATIFFLLKRDAL